MKKLMVAFLIMAFLGALGLLTGQTNTASASTPFVFDCSVNNCALFGKPNNIIINGMDNTKVGEIKADTFQGVLLIEGRGIYGQARLEYPYGLNVGFSTVRKVGNEVEYLHLYRSPTLGSPTPQIVVSLGSIISLNGKRVEVKRLGPEIVPYGNKSYLFIAGVREGTRIQEDGIVVFDGGFTLVKRSQIESQFWGPIVIGPDHKLYTSFVGQDRVIRLIRIDLATGKEEDLGLTDILGTSLLDGGWVPWVTDKGEVWAKKEGSGETRKLYPPPAPPPPPPPATTGTRNRGGGRRTRIERHSPTAPRRRMGCHPGQKSRR